jgi:ATP-dependent RNA helicase RhlB
LAGADAAGRAQTGTGKTAAFLITIFTHLLRSSTRRRRPRGARRAPWCLRPLAKLVLQIRDEAEAIGRHLRAAHVAVFGGMDYDKQRRVCASTRWRLSWLRPAACCWTTAATLPAAGPGRDSGH